MAELATFSMYTAAAVNIRIVVFKSTTIRTVRMSLLGVHLYNEARMEMR